MTPAEDVENVLNDGAARRGDDSDAAGQGGQRLLAPGSEESFGGELGLELLEGDLECSGAHGFHELGEQLHLSASLIHGDAPRAMICIPFCGLKRNRRAWVRNMTRRSWESPSLRVR